MDKSSLCAYLNERGDEYEYTIDADAADITSFKCGGIVAVAVYPKSTASLCALLQYLTDAGIRHDVIGLGTNVLVDDGGYDGVLVITTKMAGIDIDGEMLTAECGRGITACASAAQKAGLAGFSFAYGIPGSVGGAVAMNAGAYGGEIADIIVSAECYDMAAKKVVTIDKDGLSLGYRDSIIRRGGLIVLSASFKLKKGDPDAILAEMTDIMDRRRDKQPLSYPSAGSVFKRAPGHFTGRLIEDAGLKGMRIGGAEVSEKHAGFIINKENATASDVKALVELVEERVYESFGVKLEREIIYL